MDGGRSADRRRAGAGWGEEGSEGLKLMRVLNREPTEKTCPAGRGGPTNGQSKASSRPCQRRLPKTKLKRSAFQFIEGGEGPSTLQRRRGRKEQRRRRETRALKTKSRGRGRGGQTTSQTGSRDLDLPRRCDADPERGSTHRWARRSGRKLGTRHPFHLSCAAELPPQPDSKRLC